MIKNILCILLFIPFVISAQKYLPGKLEFKSGKVLVCLLKIPSNPADKKIETRLSENADKVEYSSDLLATLQVTPNNADTIEFGRVRLRKLTGGTSEAWLMVLIKGYATLYSSSNAFRVNKKGSVELVGMNHPHNAAEFNFYAIRPGESFATLLCVYSADVVNGDRVFRKFAIPYFKDCPELVKRIEKKEFKVLEVGELINEYNKIKDKSDQPGT